MTTQQQLLRIGEVTARTTLSKRTIYRMMNDGMFPQSRRINGKTVAWVASEIDEWILAQPKSDPKDWFSPNRNGTPSHKAA